VDKQDPAAQVADEAGGAPPKLDTAVRKSSKGKTEPTKNSPSSPSGTSGRPADNAQGKVQTSAPPSRGETDAESSPKSADARRSDMTIPRGLVQPGDPGPQGNGKPLGSASPDSVFTPAEVTKPRSAPKPESGPAADSSAKSGSPTIQDNPAPSAGVGSRAGGDGATVAGGAGAVAKQAGTAEPAGQQRPAGASTPVTGAAASAASAPSAPPSSGGTASRSGPSSAAATNIGWKPPAAASVGPPATPEAPTAATSTPAVPKPDRIPPAARSSAAASQDQTVVGAGPADRSGPGGSVFDPPRRPAYSPAGSVPSAPSPDAARLGAEIPAAPTVAAPAPGHVAAPQPGLAAAESVRSGDQKSQSARTFTRPGKKKKLRPSAIGKPGGAIRNGRAAMTVKSRPAAARRPAAQLSAKGIRPDGTELRDAQLVLSRIEPWSVMKFSFMASLVGFVILFVAVAVLYFFFSALGVFSSIEHTIKLVTSSGGNAGSNAASWFSAGTVLGYTMLAGAIDVILITALSTVGAVIYNAVSHLAGGVEITLREAD